jgi:hypothetical protein
MCPLSGSYVSGAAGLDQAPRPARFTAVTCFTQVVPKSPASAMAATGRESGGGSCERSRASRRFAITPDPSASLSAIHGLRDGPPSLAATRAPRARVQPSASSTKRKKGQPCRATPFCVWWRRREFELRRPLACSPRLRCAAATLPFGRGFSCHSR